MKKYCILCTEENKGFPLLKHFINHPDCKSNNNSTCGKSTHTYYFIDKDGCIDKTMSAPTGYEVLTLDQANALLGVFPRKMLHKNGYAINVLAKVKHSVTCDESYVYEGAFGNCIIDISYVKEIPQENPLKQQLQKELAKIKENIAKLTDNSKVLESKINQLG